MTTATANLDLVRYNIGNIPMGDVTADALHAGESMHFWPDLESGLSDIYHILKRNGGIYFASTFLSLYFGNLQAAEGGRTGTSKQAFQYFDSIDTLRDMMLRSGFKGVKLDIKILGRACVVIRYGK